MQSLNETGDLSKFIAGFCGELYFPIPLQTFSGNDPSSLIIIFSYVD